MNRNYGEIVTMENKEIMRNQSFLFTSVFKPALIFIAALSILVFKGYVSGKLLMGLVLLDYFTTDLINKVPIAICFLIFAILISWAVIS